MSGFLSEIAGISGMPFDMFGDGFRIVMLRDAVYAEGIKGIVAFGNERISFKAGKNILEVLGEGLNIKMLSKDDCVIIGKITSVGIK